MQHSALSRRYAEALFAYGIKNTCLPLLEEQLKTLVSVLSLPKLKLLLTIPDPKLSSVRAKVLGELKAAAPWHDALLRLLDLIVERKRVPAMPAISAFFSALIERQQHVLKVIVEAPVQPTDADLSSIVSTVEKIAGRKATCEVKLNANLIGGLRLLIGDRVFDASTAGRLAGLRSAIRAQ